MVPIPTTRSRSTRAHLPVSKTTVNALWTQTDANYQLIGKTPPRRVAVGRRRAETHSFPERRHCHATRGGNRVPPLNAYRARRQGPRARPGCAPGRRLPPTLAQTALSLCPHCSPGKQHGCYRAERSCCKIRAGFELIKG